MHSADSEQSAIATGHKAAHEKFLSHTLRCPYCYAPCVRYCAQGMELRADYDAHYLLSLDLSERRRILARDENERGLYCASVKARMIAIHAQEKQHRPSAESCHKNSDESQGS